MSTHTSSSYSLLYASVMMSSLMAVSSNNLMLTWAALEINMLTFIPLLKSSNKFQETEAMLKYFLVQAVGSTMFLMTSSSLWCEIIINKPLIMFMLVISMLIKLGMAPCHMWFPSVMTSISWTSCMILSTWQKLAPMSILMFILIPSKLAASIPIINAMIGSMMGMNQTKLKSIMAFSSITHMGWMSSFLIIMKPWFSMLYLMMYSTIIIPTFMLMYYQSTLSMNNKMNMTTPLVIMLLSLGGLPPFMGFIPKWMTIFNLIMYPTTMMVLLISSMMNLYFYLNIMFSSMMSFNINNTKPIKSYIPLIMASSTLPMMILMYI